MAVKTQPTTYLVKVHKRLLTKRRKLAIELEASKAATAKIQASYDSVQADITAIEKVT